MLYLRLLLLSETSVRRPRTVSFEFVLLSPCCASPPAPVAPAGGAAPPALSLRETWAMSVDTVAPTTDLSAEAVTAAAASAFSAEVRYGWNMTSVGEQRTSGEYTSSFLQFTD